MSRERRNVLNRYIDRTAIYQGWELIQIRDEALRLEEENLSLIANIERLESQLRQATILARAEVADRDTRVQSVVRDYEEVISKLKKEAGQEFDASENEKKKAINAIFNAHNTTSQTYENSHERRLEWDKKVEETIKTHPNYPITFQILITAYNVIAEQYTDTYRHIDKRVVLQDRELSKSPDLWLYEIKKLSEGTALDNVLSSLLGHAIAWSKHPTIVCYQIIRECEVDGKPDLNTLEGIWEWLGQNRKKLPKRETLQEWLERYQEFRKSGLSQQEFAIKNYSQYSDYTRSLRNYQEWWDLIESQSRNIPNVQELKDYINKNEVSEK